ncbi:nucleotide exchange factor GrpE [Cocleimonas sp. KMM 6892]|uniref:nucleotide exchange factor GrpE n=1 Tax=unclassified Cocleimonas TaxID=2639732 RepID=UPI002DB92D13|nr:MULTISPECIES: nucleotide exchange factor GrpE [unclassified Cocleimonas]MEB8432427.1 nucleotide exchange factor GrpE [Cocleimonas sp. KMM 6892]MEC4715286.1 nucleotide exchange factor GrpE [Cocleimonas sp. KMM 6895]MEC4745095.1 nucleotide exchange factor GrpE [Cocleimonas sp. KMM 6896]
MSESENNSNPDNMENNVENNVDNSVNNDVNNQPEEASAEMPNGAEEVTIESLQQKLEEAEAKANENWDKALRIQAEMDNLRKRSEKQVEDAHKYAVKKFVEEILPVADSLEMGYAVEGEVEQIREGIGLTMNVLKAAMEKFNVVAIDPLGEKFNPDLHQAMAMQPSEEYENDHVSAVMQKGYTLNGRLVRPAMVMVAKN